MPPSRSIAARPLSTGEVAMLCDVAISTVWRWIDRGWLKAAMVGHGERRIDKGDLVEFANERGIRLRWKLWRQENEVSR